jgi:putative ABC transport system permease protein
VPYPEDPWPTLGVAIRTPLDDPLSLAPSIPPVVASLDRGLAVAQPQTMTQAIGLNVARTRFTMLLLAAFAALALVMSAVALFGVLAYAVAQRTHEIGVRVALGAARRDVTRLVLGEGMQLAVVGLAIGVALETGVAGLLESQLYGLAPRDPATIAGAAAAILAVAFAASCLPAWWASRIDPIAALRSE